MTSTTSSSGLPAGSTSPSLIVRLREDDTTAYEDLVVIYGELIYEMCRRKGLKPDASAIVMQEVLLAVWQGVARFVRDRKGHTFQGWLRRITQFKICDHFRREVKQITAEGGTPTQVMLANLEDPYEEEGDAILVDQEGVALRALRRLEENGKTDEKTILAFRMMAIDGLPANEVAAELGISPGAVRQAKYIVLNRLRAMLGDDPLSLP